MKITFYGAAQTTTGSMHLVEANGKRMLLDCGLYQGHRKEAFEKNRNLPVDPAKIDYAILSHAHIDHSGNLPQLVRQGFRGRVFARQSTTDLCDVMLRDSCFLQKRDLEYVNKRRRRDGKKLFEPLYEESDIEALMKLFVPTHLHSPREICPGVTLEFFNAGHILGSALVQLDVTTATTTGSSSRATSASRTSRSCATSSIRPAPTSCSSSPRTQTASTRRPTTWSCAWRSTSGTSTGTTRS